VLVPGLDAAHESVAIGLLDPVAVHRIVEEEGEVGEEVERVVDPRRGS
jgi:hypothetical protein